MNRAWPRASALTLLPVSRGPYQRAPCCLGQELLATGEFAPKGQAVACAVEPAALCGLKASECRDKLIERCHLFGLSFNYHCASTVVPTCAVGLDLADIDRRCPRLAEHRTPYQQAALLPPRGSNATSTRFPENDGWAVRAAGAKRDTELFGRKQEAVDRAREIAQNQHTELVVHGETGKIQYKDRHGHDPFPPKG